MAYGPRQVNVLKRLINHYCAPHEGQSSPAFELINNKHDREAIRILVDHASPEDFNHPEYGEGLVRLEALINSI